MAASKRGSTGGKSGKTNKEGSRLRRFVIMVLTVLAIAVMSYINPEWYQFFSETDGYEDGVLYVNFIDVGQGESIFIACDGKTMLVDTGEREHSDKVTEYIKERGFSRIDVLVGTHPHSDHIGGMANVIRNMEIGDILMPKAQNNTRTFEDTMDAISEKNVPLYAPVPGDTFKLGSAEIIVLAPFKDSGGNLNNDSIVLKIVYGEHSFILTGDAEAELEKEIIEAGFVISATVLSIGHHGSVTSTSQRFLDAISPEIAVISLGSGNSYGHPHRETIDKLSKADITVYRTDINGSILISTNGKDLKINTDQR